MKNKKKHLILLLFFFISSYGRGQIDLSIYGGGDVTKFYANRSNFHFLSFENESNIKSILLGFLIEKKIDPKVSIGLESNFTTKIIRGKDHGFFDYFYGVKYEICNFSSTIDYVIFPQFQFGSGFGATIIYRTYTSIDNINFGLSDRKVHNFRYFIPITIKYTLKNIFVKISYIINLNLLKVNRKQDFLIQNSFNISLGYSLNLSKLFEQGNKTTCPTF